MKEKQDRRGAPNSRTASEAPEGPAQPSLLLPLGHVWTGEMGSRHTPERVGERLGRLRVYPTTEKGLERRGSETSKSHRTAGKSTGQKES